MEPLYTLYHVLFTTLLCGGVHAVGLLDHNLLGRWRKWMESRIQRGFGHRWLAYPILLCETCMASVYGTLMYVLLFAWQAYWTDMLIWWVPFLFQVALGNYVLWTVISTLRAIRNHHVNLGRASVQHSKSTCRTGSNR